MPPPPRPRHPPPLLPLLRALAPSPPPAASSFLNPSRPMDPVPHDSSSASSAGAAAGAPPPAVAAGLGTASNPAAAPSTGINTTAPPPPPPPPLVWLITDGASATGVDLAREVLARGHRVALGCRAEVPPASLSALRAEHGPDYVLVLELDPRNRPLCQSALAQVQLVWRRVDVVVLCGAARSVVGTLEESSEWHLREQFEASFYGPVNLITTFLPTLRRQLAGHVVCVTGITGQMGTPALGLVSAAAHALEGYLEALAFEVAPFNVKVSIVQPSLEASVLSAPVAFTKQLEHYKNTVSATVRAMLSCTDLAPELLVKDTVYAITSIAGIDNPPLRIVAGAEAIEQTRDKLRTVSEEMEDMLEVSYAADADPLTEAQRRELAGE
ncbi:uncharacterized protein V1518DRAFT_419405 [Limtongia smithiae]|uniref:uncharacterized protein n=1 Tax=Limtongia smithiae TaxID=1125753 RepID=UPI0034CE49AF